MTPSNSQATNRNNIMLLSRKKFAVLFAGYLVFCALNLLLVYYLFPVRNDNDMQDLERKWMLIGVLITLNNHIVLGCWIIVYYRFREWRKRKAENAQPERTS